jgi:hypothetical protein
VLGAAGDVGFVELSLDVDVDVDAGAGVAGVEVSPLVSLEAGGVTDAVEFRLSFL